jgi:hypothetical protein
LIRNARFMRENAMKDRKRDPGNVGPDKAAQARKLAEQGLHEQALGHVEEADRLLSLAQEADPDAVADVLREHDAARAPDARLQATADQDVERVLPRIKPGPESGSS